MTENKRDFRTASGTVIPVVVATPPAAPEREALAALTYACRQASFALRTIAPDDPDAQFTVRIIDRALAAAAPDATADSPVMLNGLTEAETAATASVFGLSRPTPPTPDERAALAAECKRLTPCAYRFDDNTRIEEAQQIEGPPLWAVRRRFGDCLNRSGEWEHEPMPSSRDDGFLARCRFASPAEALAAIDRLAGKP